MYAFTGDNWKQVGQDVNQGANVICPYQMKTITSRYFSTNGETFDTYQGYYYIAINDDGDECKSGFDQLSYNLGHLNCTGGKVGTFSCGEVWFRAFED